MRRVHRIAVGSTNPVKVRAGEWVARRVFGQAVVECLDVPPGVPDQPHGEAQARRGALNRARAAREVEDGRELGEAMGRLTGIRDVKRKMGAMGVLTRGLIDREQACRQAVTKALVPFLNPELFGQGLAGQGQGPEGRPGEAGARGEGSGGGL